MTWAELCTLIVDSSLSEHIAFTAAGGMINSQGYQPPAEASQLLRNSELSLFVIMGLLQTAATTPQAFEANAYLELV